MPAAPACRQLAALASVMPPRARTGILTERAAWCNRSQALRWTPGRFGDRLEDGAEDGEIGALGFGAAYFFQGVGGDGDLEAGRGDRAQIGGRDGVGGQVHAMSAGGQGDIGARVDQNARGGRVREGQNGAGELVQVARREVLLADLEEIDALAEGALDEPQERLRAAGGLAAGDGIAQHHSGS